MPPCLAPRPRAPCRQLRAGLALLLAASLAQAAGAQDEAAYYRHASSCVAAIKQEVLALVARPGSDQPPQRDQILRLTEQSFAFVGTAYKMGLRNPEAKQMLEAAEQQHEALAATAQRALAASCQTEGARLVTEANVFERLLLRNRAAARVDKLLAPPKAP